MPVQRPSVAPALRLAVPERPRIQAARRGRLCFRGHQLCVRAENNSSLPNGGFDQKYEISVCVNKVCKRQGSRQILRFAEDLRLSNSEVRSTGCLGKCGNGPNIVICSSSEEFVKFSHVTSPHRLAGILSSAIGVSVDETTIHATELRTMGTSLAQSGDLQGAIERWNEAIALQPPHGLHALYSNRSAARLTLGDKEGALEDALRTVELAPRDFTTGHIRLIDALYALRRIPEATEALINAVQADPQFRHTNDYKTIKKALDTAMG